MKIPFSDNRTSRRIVTTYLLVGLVPLLFLGSMLLAEISNSRRAAIYDEYEKSLVQASTGFDRIIDSIEAISTHFSTQYSAGRFEQMDSLERQFAAYKDSFDLPGDLFFYRRGEQEIWTAEGVQPYAQFESAYGFGSELTMASFFSKLNTILSSTCFPSMGYDGESHYFIYLQPVPILSNTPEGVLVYIVHAQAIRESLLETLDAFHGYFCVFTPDHRNIYLMNEEADADEQEMIQTLNRLRGVGWQNGIFASERYEMLRHVTDRRAYVYACAIPTGFMFDSLNRRQIIYVGILLAAAVVSAVIALLVARKQYQPVKQLAQSLQIEEDPESGESGELFESINERLKHIRNENEQLVLQMHSYTREARARFLQDLLEGKLSRQENITLAMRASGMHFSWKYFCVMVLNVSASGNAAVDEGPEQFFEEVDFRQGKACSLPIDAENRLALLINTSISEPTELLRIAQQFRSRLTSLGFDSPEGVGISRIRTDLLRVNRQLFEAYIALENHTQFYSVGSGESLREELQETELFRQSLLFGNSVSVRKNLAHILNMADREHWALDHRQALYFRLTNILMTVSLEQNSPLDASELSPLASAAHRESFEAALLQRAEALCEKMAEKKESDDTLLNGRVIDYIYEHFNRNELSLKMVADAFSLSETTLRKIIHEATGTTFGNYISSLRISYVKKQLAETDLPIRAIAESAGYLDVSSFTRKFRTSEGVTPGQYRAAIRGTDEKES